MPSIVHETNSAANRGSSSLRNSIIFTSSIVHETNSRANRNQAELGIVYFSLPPLFTNRIARQTGITHLCDRPLLRSHVRLRTCSTAHACACSPARPLARARELEHPFARMLVCSARSLTRGRARPPVRLLAAPPHPPGRSFVYRRGRIL